MTSPHRNATCTVARPGRAGAQRLIRPSCHEHFDGGRAPITDRDSPIVLLGDSHLLVFHIGTDMHAIGAGLGDHLAARLGFPLDVVGVRGSGATASRMTLVRRRDNLEGKRMIIWCLSARELTEASAWARLPAALPPR